MSNDIEFIESSEAHHIARGGGRPEGIAVLKDVGGAAAGSIDRENRIVQFKVSDESIDREKDTIALGGWELEDYGRNPVVLFGHDHHQPPVAKSLATLVEGNALKSRAQFPTPETYEFGALIFRLYLEGFMRGTSVGFIPLEWTYDKERGGVNFQRQTLLEYSAVPVPANASALVDAGAKGINLAPLKRWAEHTLDGLGNRDPRRKSTEAIWSQMHKDALVSLAGLDIPSRRRGDVDRADLQRAARLMRRFRASGRMSTVERRHLGAAERHLAIVLDGSDNVRAASSQRGDTVEVVDDGVIDVDVRDLQVALRDAARHAASDIILRLTGRVDLD